MARIVILLCVILIIAFGVWSFFTQSNEPAATSRIRPKILTVTMDQDGDPQTTKNGEASAWVQNDKLDQKVDLVGGNGPVYCNATYEHCLVITGVGVMNASATLMALGLSEKFDLSKTYIMVAGIAGTKPEMATIGTAAWAKYIVYGGLADGMDPRGIPGCPSHVKAEAYDARNESKARVSIPLADLVLVNLSLPC